VTDSADEVKAYEGIVITYADQPLKGIHIVPAGLLWETGVEPGFKLPIQKLAVDLVKEGYDLLSAVFWFISRYEEWQPFKVDAHDRFGHQQSILYATHETNLPVVDIWLSALRQQIEAKYITLQLPPRVFRIVSTIDVDNLFAYTHKSVWRALGAHFKDLLLGRKPFIAERKAVRQGTKKDPFDVYEEVSKFCQVQHIPLFWFFLLRSGTKYDRTVTQSRAFERPIHEALSSGAKVGLHPSYYSPYNPGQLGAEFDLFEKISRQPAVYSRQHYLRYDIRWTPFTLQQFGIQADFTMGYAEVAGFRAGTTQVFNFYDFENECATALKCVPFCAMDGAYFATVDDAMKALKSLRLMAETIRQTGGNFITVFHERSFDEVLYPGYRQVYFKLYEQLAPLAVW